MEEFIDLVDFGDLFVAYHGQSPQEPTKLVVKGRIPEGAYQ